MPRSTAPSSRADDPGREAISNAARTPCAVSTMAITGGPSGPSAATASGVAFGSTIASRSSSARSARSSSNHGVSTPLDANTFEGLSLGHVRGGQWRRASRASALAAGATASSRSATTRVGFRGRVPWRACARRCPARRGESGGGRARRPWPVYMSDIRRSVKRGLCLTRPRKSDINPLAGHSARGREVDGFEGSPVPRVRRPGRAQGRGGRGPRARPRRSGDRRHRLGAEPPRRRHPRGHLALPGRASRTRSGSRSWAVSRSSARASTGWQVGERVLPYLMDTCGACRYCRTGRESLCLAPGFISFSTGGGYAEQLACSVRAPDPDPRRGSDVDAAALQVAFATSWHMLFTRAKLRAGRDRADQLGRQRDRLGGRSARQAGGRVRDRQRVERREARARAATSAWTPASTTRRRTSSRR